MNSVFWISPTQAIPGSPSLSVRAFSGEVGVDTLHHQSIDIKVKHLKKEKENVGR